MFVPVVKPGILVIEAVNPVVTSITISPTVIAGTMVVKSTAGSAVSSLAVAVAASVTPANKTLEAQIAGKERCLMKPNYIQSL